MDIKGCDLVDRIDSVLMQKNLKRQALADYCNFNVANIAHWKARNNIPGADTIFLISNYLGITVEWLLTGEDPSGISEAERMMLQDWRDIEDTNERRLIRNLIGEAAQHARSEKNKTMEAE